MTSTHAFAERISSFMLRDSVFLGIDPAALESTPPSQSRAVQKAADRRSRKTSRKATTPPPQPPAPIRTLHVNQPVQLIKARLAHDKAKAQHAAETPSAHGSENGTSSTRTPAPTIFRLADLPQEIRDMIYKYMFIITSGSNPKFLHAASGNKELYANVFDIFCATNNFTISLRTNGRREEGGVEGMELAHIKLVKSLTIAVPKDIIQTQTFTSPLTLHAQILDLALSVSTPNSLRVAAYSVLPCFKHLHTLTIILRNAHRQLDGRRLDRVAHMNSFADMLALVDKVVGVKGGKYSDPRGKKKYGKVMTRQVWVWKAGVVAEGGKEERRSVMNVLKKHVKLE